MAAMTIKIRPMFKLLATLQFIAVVFVFIIGASQSRSASDNFWSINRGDLYNTNPTGRVGIGTTSPNNLLQVRELINFDNSKWNTFLGYQAGDSITTGYFNTAVGYHALYSGAAGIRNTAVGRNALYSNTTGYNNVAIGGGDGNLYANTTGYGNIAIGGDQVLYSNTTGFDNVAVGIGAHRPGRTVRSLLGDGDAAGERQPDAARRRRQEGKPPAGDVHGSEQRRDDGGEQQFVGHRSGTAAIGGRCSPSRALDKPRSAS